MLDASQATVPLAMTASDLADPLTLIAEPPIAPMTLPAAATSQLDPYATLPSEVTSTVALPTLPSPSCVSDSEASNASPGTIRPKTLAPMSTLQADASSYMAGMTSVSGGGAVSGGGSSSGGGPSSGGGSDLTPFSWFDVVSDGGGTVVDTISYAPNPDGSFSLAIEIAFSSGATSTDPSSPSNGASGDLQFDITAGAGSVTFSIQQTFMDSWDENDVITGPGDSGTLTDSGSDTVTTSNTATINADGTTSVTATNDTKFSDTYQLTDGSATDANGNGFTVSDGGTDTDHSHGATTVNADGCGTSSKSDDATASETTNLDEARAYGVTIHDTNTDQRTSDETGGSSADAGGANPTSNDTVTNTDVGNDSMTGSGSGPFNGATYSGDSTQADTYNNSDTATTNSSGGTTTATENATESGTTTGKSDLTVSGVDDSSVAPGATSDTITENTTSDGTYHDVLAPSTDPTTGAPVETWADTFGGDSSFSESGTDAAGPFSDTRSEAETNGVGTPSNEVETGTLPSTLGSSPLSTDAMYASMLVSNDGTPASLALPGMTAQDTASPAPAGAPANLVPLPDGGGPILAQVGPIDAPPPGFFGEGPAPPVVAKPTVIPDLDAAQFGPGGWKEWRDQMKAYRHLQTWRNQAWGEVLDKAMEQLGEQIDALADQAAEQQQENIKIAFETIMVANEAANEFVQAQLAAVRAGHPLSISQLGAALAHAISQHKPEQTGGSVAGNGVVAASGQVGVGGGGTSVTISLPGGGGGSVVIGNPTPHGPGITITPPHRS